MGIEATFDDHQETTTRHQCDCIFRRSCLIAKNHDSENSDKNQRIKKKSLSKGDFLFREDTKAESIYMIRVGAIKVCHPDSKTALNHYFPGDIVGVGAAFINQGRHHLNAQALDDTLVCELPWNQFTQHTRHDPELALRISELVSTEVNQGYERIIVMSKKRPLSRIAAFIVSYSTRMQRMGLSQTEFNFPISISELAIYLGLARETVSRQLSAIREQGIVDIRGKRLRIRSAEGLAELAEPISLNSPLQQPSCANPDP